MPRKTLLRSSTPIRSWEAQLRLKGRKSLRQCTDRLALWGTLWGFLVMGTQAKSNLFKTMAGTTGLEPAASAAEPKDAARVLIHDDQDPVGPQRGRLAPEQIYTPEAVFHLVVIFAIRNARTRSNRHRSIAACFGASIVSLPPVRPESKTQSTFAARLPVRSTTHTNSPDTRFGTARTLSVPREKRLRGPLSVARHRNNAAGNRTPRLPRRSSPALRLKGRSRLQRQLLN